MVIKKKRPSIGYLMVAPTIIGLIVLNIIPFFSTFWLSFNESQGFGKMSWVGIENYVTLFSDPQVWQSTLNTLLYVVYTVPLGVTLALVLACLLNTQIRGKSVFRAIYFLPIVVAPAAVAMVWKWLFNAEGGLINYLLSLISVAGPKWLSEPGVALVSCAIVAIWSTVGYDLILILSGLQNISTSYYEAARIDGASPIKQFFHITVPLVSPTLFFVLTMRLMGSFKQFDTIYMLVSETNPAFDSSQSLMYLFYRQSFIYDAKGYASSIVLWTFFIIMFITLFQFVFQKKWVHYD